MKANVNNTLATLVCCWKITRSDGKISAFTESDQELEIEKVIYHPGTAVSKSAIANSNNFAVDNLEIEAVLDSEHLTESDILAGKFDSAEVEVFLASHLNPNSEKTLLRRGSLGEVTIKGGSFVAEIRGLMQNYSQKIGELYSPMCRTHFGDHRCKLKTSEYTFLGRILKPINDFSFFAKISIPSSSCAAVGRLETRGSTNDAKGITISKPNQFFNYGLLKFTSGKNAGLTFEVREYHDDEITLSTAPVEKLAAGDEFEIIAGCDKTHHTCINKFNNILNFRGEPHIPEREKFVF